MARKKIKKRLAPDGKIVYNIIRKGLNKMRWKGNGSFAALVAAERRLKEKKQPSPAVSLACKQIFWTTVIAVPMVYIMDILLKGAM